MSDVFPDSNTEPEWSELSDNEMLGIARRLVVLINTVAYELGRRGCWVLFESKERSMNPRKHDPQSIEMHIWKEFDR